MGRDNSSVPRQCVDISVEISVACMCVRLYTCILYIVILETALENFASVFKVSLIGCIVSIGMSKHGGRQFYFTPCALWCWEPAWPLVALIPPPGISGCSSLHFPQWHNGKGGERGNSI